MGAERPAVIAIRPATPGDLDALLRLYVQLSAGNAATDPARTANAFAAMLRTPNLHLLVATVGELVVGTVTVVIVPNLTHNATPWAQLENMVVDETRRGKGVGQQLLRAAVDLAWEAGCYKVQLQSANEREDAHRFYAAFGFAPSSVGFRLYR